MEGGPGSSTGRAAAREGGYPGAVGKQRGQPGPARGFTVRNYRPGSRR